jgi:hypothetical protein
MILPIVIFLLIFGSLGGLFWLFWLF